MSQHGNSPVHKARTIKTRFAMVGVKELQWLPQSADHWNTPRPLCLTTAPDLTYALVVD